MLRRVAMKNSELFFSTLIVLLLTFTLLFFSNEQITLLLPLITIISISFFTLFMLIRREGKIEIFDAGALLIAITALYCSFPLISFAINGFELTPFVDNRLKQQAMTATKMGLFAWNHVTYFAALSFSYLYFRPRQTIHFGVNNLRPINEAEIFIGLVFMAALTAWSIIIPILFGDTFPYFITQLNNNFAALFFVMSIWFFVIAATKWNNNFIKILLFIYILFEFIKLVLGMSGRTWFALHMLAFAMVYHKLINPFSTRQVIVYGSLFLTLFLLFGFIRTGQASLLTIGVGFFTGNEEFTSLFATAYDVNSLIESGEVQEVPLAVWSFDFNQLIPSQFLPFEKIAQTDWYLVLRGWQDDGIGLGFGAIAQGMIGWGKLDLLLRGIVTGAFFGYLHRLINRANISIWTIILYVFLAIKGYNTYRNGTGYILYFIVYQYLPCFLLVKFFLISSNPHSKKLTAYN